MIAKDEKIKEAIDKLVYLYKNNGIDSDASDIVKEAIEILIEGLKTND